MCLPDPQDTAEWVVTLVIQVSEHLLFLKMRTVGPSLLRMS